MLSTDLRRLVIVVFGVLLVSQTCGVSPAACASEPTSRPGEVSSPQWREATLTRVILRSNADWGRILFDDMNGTNSNGIRIRSVISSGYLRGRESDDLVYAGHKIAWPDTEYDRVVTRKGDMVAFFKGLGDFHDTEVYADLTLEINIDLTRVYVWLMTGGNGTTTFEIVSHDTGGIIWRDIIVGTGETQQVKRMMSPQPFLRTGRAETTIVVTWLSIIIVAIIALNFPIVEVLRERMRRRSGSRRVSEREQDGYGQK